RAINGPSSCLRNFIKYSWRLTPRFRRGGRTPNAPTHRLPTRPPSPATGCWAARRSRNHLQQTRADIVSIKNLDGNDPSVDQVKDHATRLSVEVNVPMTRSPALVRW